MMKEILAALKKERKEKQMILLSALAFLVFGLLPWISISLFGYSENFSSWHDFGILANLSALVILLIWSLAQFKVKLPINENQTILAEKSASALLLFSTLIFAFRFQWSYLTIIFYLCLILAMANLVFSFDLLTKLPNKKKPSNKK